MAPVGVPGLILGGGISHFASKLGWACDNVASFELVTASGLPITVSPTSHPDLFWALRGGGNNLGLSRISNSTRFLWARCGVAIAFTLRAPSPASWTPSVSLLLKGRRKTRTPPRFWYVYIMLSSLSEVDEFLDFLYLPRYW